MSKTKRNILIAAGAAALAFLSLSYYGHAASQQVAYDKDDVQRSCHINYRGPQANVYCECLVAEFDKVSGFSAITALRRAETINKDIFYWRKEVNDKAWAAAQTCARRI